MLRAAALRAGAERASADFVDAEIAANGIVERLTLADGTAVQPWLVLDCSGTDARIASRTSPASEDWSGWLPCDRTHAETVPAQGAPPPYTQVDAQDTGWTATWPLDGADVRLTCSIGGTGKPFHAARRVEAWRGNCVALGAAAGLLEPLHPTTLTLLLRSLAQLIQLWPAGPQAPVEATAFNRTAAGAYRRARLPDRALCRGRSRRRAVGRPPRSIATRTAGRQTRSVCGARAVADV
ncbi:hypothetical protein NI18_00780 [Sphingomonas sp. Ant20]|nr:hypothetical protein NI18_00780 [Sphingomonas sp. Ant20]